VSRKKIRTHYEHRISPHRESYDILDWSDAASQQARFEVLAKHVELRGKRLLDVGCGLGDLLTFLRSREMDVDYTGVDLLEKMTTEAGRRNPGGRFICADVFDPAADQPFEPESFDVVFCSGAFNLNLGNNIQFIPLAARRMLGLSGCCVVFNLLHKRQAAEEERYFHWDPAEVLKLLQPLDCDCQIIDDYLPNDFTVLCRKAR